MPFDERKARLKTEVIKIDPDFPEIEKIIHCAKGVRKGALVLFPTETVYGIAANFNDDKAMRRLREVKKRSTDKPFSVLISQKELISNYTSAKDAKIYKLIDECWPGPLTVVVPGLEGIPTIGVRMPQNRIAICLVEESQCTVAAPSANFEGNPPPSTCADALHDLDGLVDIAIDGGEATFGVASSVVDFTQGIPTVLREGVITQSQVDAITKRKHVLFVCTGNSCRSVMAEYLLRKMLSGRSEVEVHSAGTSVFLRSTASAETIHVLAKQGIDARAHFSQPLNNIVVNKSDLILVMTRAHRHLVLEHFPSAEKKIYLLKEFAEQTIGAEMELDISDPMGKSHSAYEECFATIKGALNNLFKLI